MFWYDLSAYLSTKDNDLKLLQTADDKQPPAQDLMICNRNTGAVNGLKKIRKIPYVRLRPVSFSTPTFEYITVPYGVNKSANFLSPISSGIPNTKSFAPGTRNRSEPASMIYHFSQPKRSEITTFSVKHKMQLSSTLFSLSNQHFYLRAKSIKIITCPLSL